MQQSGIVLAVDAGTTGVRSMAVGTDGTPLATSYQELTQHYPRPGWVEHDPEEIWQAAAATLGGVVERLEAPVAAIGITNQRETVVAWDRRSGRPLHRAVVWQDRRTARLCESAEKAGYLPAVRERTGLVLDPYFSASKMAWLLSEGGVEASPGLALGTVDSWLLWRLTGGQVHATDPSNASRTLLFDIRRLEWDPELASIWGVPLHALAEVRPSAGTFGRTATGALPALGPGIPISGMAGDQQASLLGQACLSPGMAKNTYGTGSFVLMNVGGSLPEPAEGLLSTVAWQLADGRVDYALEGSIFVTGAAVQWLRDSLGLVSSAREVGPLAESVPGSGGLYLVPAFAGLGSPWWDPLARGALLGAGRGMGRAQLARAVVESMAYQTRDVVEAMCRHSAQELAELRVDGGAAAMDLLLQLQADQLGVPVLRSSVAETTALGAAFLAGLGAGVWGSVSDLASRWRPDAKAVPSADRKSADDAYAGWRRAVERARRWAEG